MRLKEKRQGTFRKQRLVFRLAFQAYQQPNAGNAWGVYPAYVSVIGELSARAALRPQERQSVLFGENTKENKKAQPKGCAFLFYQNLPMLIVSSTHSGFPATARDQCSGSPSTLRLNTPLLLPCRQPCCK